VDEIEAQNSDWVRILSLQGIFAGRESSRFYYLTVYEGYFAWFNNHTKFELDLYPLKPVEEEVQRLGQSRATRNNENRCFYDGINGIFDGCGPGFESYYREILPVRGVFELASATHDVLVGLLSFLPTK
jgi:hypothetical protein